MKRSLRFVVIGLGITAVVVAQPYRVVMVDGGSMSPTYESGSLVMASRFDPDLHHGDVVVFKHDGDTFVKRIAFLPGDRILQYEFAHNWYVPNNDFVIQAMRRHHIPMRLWPVPDDQIFVVGDNFYQSIDSRTFGTIPISDVVGTVTDPPRPDLLQGFAGAKEISDDHVIVRKLPLTGKVAKRAKLYVASMEHHRRPARPTIQN